MTLRFERRGYITAQRQAEAPWKDYADVADLVLVPYDSEVTEVDLGAIDGFQVARGSAVTDGDGSRQATMLFAEGTDAEMVMPDGSTGPLDTLDVRATEYTIGDDGEDAMPAALPPASGYTYAVELSVDEAVDAGATEVRFDKPVATYVENFLEFPVGERRARPATTTARPADWVAAPNGRVIEIVGEAGGAAAVDADGDGGADSAAQLAALGITAAEREQLAGLYDPGKTLWRVAGDPLHAVGLQLALRTAGRRDRAAGPAGARRTTRRGRRRSASATGRSSAARASGSARRSRSRAPAFSLDYWSDQVPGRLERRALEIPLTPASVPASLRGVHLEIPSPGARSSTSSAPAPNQRYSFTWDGFDAYGRPAGGRPARDRPASATSTASSATRRRGAVRRGVRPAASGAPSSTATRDRRTTSRSGARPATRSRRAAGGFDARGVGLGGWTLDAHHLYDPRTHTVYMGDGRRGQRRADHHHRTRHGPAAPVRRPGRRRRPPRRRGSATPTTSRWPRTAPCSSPRSSRRDVGRIRRIRPDGTIETYVSGIGSPRGIALGPDGSLYVTQANLGTILRVAPDRTVTRFAGTGAGAGRAATAARPPARWSRCRSRSPPRPTAASTSPTATPSAGRARRDHHHRRRRRLRRDRSATAARRRDAQLGFVDGIAVGPDGELYIGHSDNGSGAGNRIRRVDAGGTITTVAGGGPDPDDPGDGGPGTEATIGIPYGMDVGPDGALYFAERAAAAATSAASAPDGVITTVARPRRELRRHGARRPRAGAAAACLGR